MKTDAVSCSGPIGRRGFTLPEILLAAALVLLLLLMLLPAIKRNRELARPSRGGTNSVAAEIRRIESAKALYAADHGLKVGTLVTMNDLVRGGYLKTVRPLPNIEFEVSAVGTPVTYTFDTAGRQKHTDRDSHSHEHSGSAPAH